MKQKNNRKGFTIVELVIVIAVIGILATVLVPSFGDVISSAKESAAKQGAKNAYTTYLVEHSGTAPEVMVYMHANGKVVALEKGVPVHVYETAAAFFAAYEEIEEFTMTAGVIYTTTGEAGSGGSEENKQLFNPDDAVKNYYINSTGAEEYRATSGGLTWYITDYMPVDGNNTYGYSNLNTAGSAPHSAFYDANKNLISVFKQVQGENVALVIPSNAAYVRFSVLQNASGVFGFAFWNGVSFEDEDILTDSDFWSKISICINGDSIETESAGLWSKMLRDQIAFESYKNIAVGGTRMKGQINSETE